MLVFLAALPAVITWPFPPGIPIGPITLHFYALSYLLAFLAGGTLAISHARRHGIPRKVSEDLAFWSILTGLLGARLYFVAQSDPLWYLTHPLHIFAVWEGGMAYFGAIFAVIATLLFLSWRRHLLLPVVFDAAALFAAAGQPIGRLGNFANGEITGPPSTLPWAVVWSNPAALAPSHTIAYQPANLYECLGALCILALLLILRRAHARPGALSLAYLLAYPVSQLLLFHWRTDASTPVIAFGLKQAQLTSLVVLAFVIPFALWAWPRLRHQSAHPIE